MKVEDLLGSHHAGMDALAINKTNMEVNNISYSIICVPNDKKVEMCKMKKYKKKYQPNFLNIYTI